VKEKRKKSIMEVNSSSSIRFHITGFGPFAGVPSNPSSILVNQLVSEIDPSIVSNYIVEVSTVGANSILQLICEDIESNITGVDVLLHFGVAAGASKINIEECAYNDADFRVPDVLGYQPVGEAITPSLGPRTLSLNTCLDCSELETMLNRRGWGNEAVSRSTNPGRFLCNYIYFKSLSASQDINLTQDLNRRRVVSLFVHVPLHSVIDEPSQLRFATDLILSIKDLITRKCYLSPLPMINHMMP
jgi:pyroglutamyl-peptidase